jgi:hypothetical protein
MAWLLLVVSFVAAVVGVVAVLGYMSDRYAERHDAEEESR